MISVILDSSDKYLVVALAKDNKIFEKVDYECWQRQSELMISELDSMLNKHNFSKDDIGEVVVSRGPGSYTGVRVALTIAKIIGTVLPVKIYSVSSLETLKDPSKTSICLANARSGRSYFGVYGDNKVIENDKILTNDEVLKYIDSHKDYQVCGDVTYLGLEKSDFDIANSLLLSRRSENLVKDVLALKPQYLKD